jgi:hypothetical protein
MQLAVLAATLAATSIPATAQVAHRTSMNHNGQTVTVSYEPRFETKLRQIGIGPRSAAACRWSSKVTVERKVTTADGQPIAALAGSVPDESAGAKMARSGQRAGRCSWISEELKARLAGSDEAVRSHVARVAMADAPRLRTELASLDKLSTGESYAR